MSRPHTVHLVYLLAPYSVGPGVWSSRVSSPVLYSSLYSYRRSFSGKGGHPTPQHLSDPEMMYLHHLSLWLPFSSSLSVHTPESEEPPGTNIVGWRSLVAGGAVTFGVKDWEFYFYWATGRSDSTSVRHLHLDPTTTFVYKVVVDLRGFRHQDFVRIVHVTRHPSWHFMTIERKVIHLVIVKLTIFWTHKIDRISFWDEVSGWRRPDTDDVRNSGFRLQVCVWPLTKEVSGPQE